MFGHCELGVYWLHRTNVQHCASPWVSSLAVGVRKTYQRHGLCINCSFGNMHSLGSDSYCRIGPPDLNRSWGILNEYNRVNNLVLFEWISVCIYRIRFVIFVVCYSIFTVTMRHVSLHSHKCNLSIWKPCRGLVKITPAKLVISFKINMSSGRRWHFKWLRRLPNKIVVAAFQIRRPRLRLSLALCP